MKTSFTYDHLDGVKCTGTVIIDCSKASIVGLVTRRILNEDSDEYEDVEAFYILWNGIEYGKIGMVAGDFITLCQEACCTDEEGGGGEGEGIFAMEFAAEFE